jgi:ankyrin repeat protein
VRNRQLEAVELLLRSGANPNLTTGLATPLINSIYSEAWDVMHLLLKSRANVNVVGTNKATALHVAVKHKCDASLVKLLLKHGADRFRKDIEGLTPLDWAKRNADKVIIRTLESFSKG